MSKRVIFSVDTNGDFRWSAAPTNNGDVGWLTVGGDGNLYGACPNGGSNSHGQIVSLDANGEYRWTFSFGQTNGAMPSGPLTAGADGSLYGVATNGGKNGQGVVFSIDTNGALRWFYSFTGTRHGPFGSLIQGTNGDLYGVTYAPGLFNSASVFSISTNGATNWFYTPGNVNTPNGSLVQGADGNLYVGSSGRVFSVATNGSFRWSATVGGSMLAQRSDGDVFSSTFFSMFTIYSITASGQTDGTAIFTNVSQGRLVEDSAGNMFGAVGPYPNSFPHGGGSQVFELLAPPRVISQPRSVMDLNGAAVTFSVSALGAPALAYQWQEDGTNLTDGGNITGTQSDQLTLATVGEMDAASYSVTVSNFYGMATSAPAMLSVTNSFPLPGGRGTFTIPDAATFSANDNPGLPYALMAGNDGALYGSTISGQTFRATTNGIVQWKTAPIFGHYATDLIQGIDGLIYVSDGFGFFSYTTNGVSVQGNLSGFVPSGIVQGPDLTLYWTKLELKPAVYATATNDQTLWIFTNVVAPNDIILGRNGDLYGTDERGGTNNDGAVFSLTTNGDLIWAYSFAGSNGLYPDGVIQGNDGNLYGLTYGDGSNNVGGVFSMSADGVLNWSFLFDIANGATPHPKLLQATDGNLYGTTASGGRFGRGTIYQITTNGVMSVIYMFTGGSDGSTPVSGLVQAADGSLYGVAELNGFDGAGTLYRLDLGLPSRVVPPNLTAPVFQSVTVSNGMVALNWTAVSNVSYQLQFSGDLTAGTWSNTGPAIAATSAVTTVSVTASGPQGFYRLLAAP